MFNFLAHKRNWLSSYPLNSNSYLNFKLVIRNYLEMTNCAVLKRYYCMLVSTIFVYVLSGGFTGHFISLYDCDLPDALRLFL